eukprot:TRINITY_DN25986_c0_g1_i1.p1 TRINITY_DN25986_c0_g1~~TRINITY_DN25986_c0_g1_i1.p1  ORF type:complete len:964 (-),score=196.09 TRINITY_DN25986_c0_g1_i1:24-2915(-)
MAANAEMKLSNGRVISPALTGGNLSAYPATFSTSGSRVFVPCGGTALCYSVKTTRELGRLTGHDGKVTAVCAGVALADCAEPLASGCANGEVRLWDSKNLSLLGSVSLGMPVLALRWPRPDALLVLVGTKRKMAEVRQIDASVLRTPKQAAASVPLSADEAGAFDAAAGAVALVDGRELCVWAEGWPRCCRYGHERRLTAVAVDPQRRYVTVGDDRGVIWTWWGVLDGACGDGDSANRVPGRFHWHPNAVRCLGHLGPIVLSGGDKGVIVYRRSDNDVPQFVPGFPAPLLHMATSHDGLRICVSLADNSLAIVQDLHSWVKPRYIFGLAVPPLGPSLGGVRRGSGLRRPVLHAIAQGGGVVAASGGDQRVQFLDPAGRVMPSHTLSLRKTNWVKQPGNKHPEQRWALWQIAFSADASCVMSCERRLSPALHAFDAETAESYVVKWWRRANENTSHILDSIANNPHTGEVTVTLAHPQREHFFVTASADGTFKSWDWLPIGAGGQMDRSAVPAGDAEEEDELDDEALAGDDPASKIAAEAKAKAQMIKKEAPIQTRCWQCVAVGSWHGRSVCSGAFCMDGSVLALGYQGFVVLWDAERAAQLQVIALTEGNQVPCQLSFGTACSRFLLVAGTRDPKGREAVVCWDMLSLEEVARQDLTVNAAGAGAAAAAGHLVLRVAEPGVGTEPLHVLAFRELGEDAKQKDGSKGDQIQLLQLAAPSDLSATKMNFSVRASATLPPGRSVLDATFRPSSGSGDDALRLTCWMSDLELWDLDLLKGQAEGDDVDMTGTAEARRRQGGTDAGPDGQEVAAEDGDEDDVVEGAKSKLAKIVGGREADTKGVSSTIAGSGGKFPRFLAPPLRSTPAQQSGLLAQLLVRVLPPHVPSHLLPPPSVLFASLLSVFGKPAPSRDAGVVAIGAASGADAKAAEKEARKGSQQPQVVAGEGSEFVDSAFMDQLVKDAFAAS